MDFPRWLFDVNPQEVRGWTSKSAKFEQQPGHESSVTNLKSEKLKVRTSEKRHRNHTIATLEIRDL